MFNHEWTRIGTNDCGQRSDASPNDLKTVGVKSRCTPDGHRDPLPPRLLRAGVPIHLFRFDVELRRIGNVSLVGV